MALKHLFQFHKPTAYLTYPARLVSRQYSVFVEADAYRNIWIASRFCCGLNGFMGTRYRVRLIAEGKPDFELAREKQLLRFQLVDGYEEDTQLKEDRALIDANMRAGCIGAIKGAMHTSAGEPLPSPASLVCLIHLVSTTISEETIRAIVQGLGGVPSTLGEVWLFIYEEILEDEESPQRQAGDDRVYPYSLIKLYPQANPRYSYEINTLLREIMVFRLVLAGVGIFILLGLIQFYALVSRNSAWDIFEFIKMIAYKFQSQPYEPEF
jgi:hypothetical protein